jgi:hypothetical protein
MSDSPETPEVVETEGLDLSALGESPEVLETEEWVTEVREEGEIVSEGVEIQIDTLGIRGRFAILFLGVVLGLTAKKLFPPVEVDPNVYNFQGEVIGNIKDGTEIIWEENDE